MGNYNSEKKYVENTIASIIMALLKNKLVESCLTSQK